MLKRNSKGQFIKGNTEGGRKKGCRTRVELTKAFITDLANHWEQHGTEVLEKLLADNPAAYARVVAQTIPRDDSLLVEHTGSTEVRKINIGFLEPDQDKDEDNQEVTH